MIGPKNPNKLYSSLPRFRSRCVVASAYNQFSGQDLKRIAAAGIVDQRGSRTCHTVTLAALVNIVAADELSLITAGHGLSTGELIMDAYMSRGADSILEKVVGIILAAVDSPGCYWEQDLRNEIACSLQNGNPERTFQKLKVWGGVSRSMAQSSIDETYDLFEQLEDQVLSIVASGEGDPTIIKSQLLAGGLGKLLEHPEPTVLLEEQHEIRQKVRKVLERYTMQCRNIGRWSGYSQNRNTYPFAESYEWKEPNYQESTQNFLSLLANGPVVLADQSHVTLLLGHAKDENLFYLQDSLSSTHTRALTIQQLLRRGFLKAYYLVKE